MSEYRAASGSSAEDLFIELFTDTFGAEKAGYLYSQFHFYDIYQNDRFADFFLENGGKRIAIEIDDEASHNPSVVSRNRYRQDCYRCDGCKEVRWQNALPCSYRRACRAGCKDIQRALENRQCRQIC